MKEFGFNTQLRAVIVGSTADEFVRQMKKLLGDYEVNSVLCEDIYSAVGVLAKSRNENVLVVGRFEQLGKEQGRFFHIASENGCICCCLVKPNSAQGRNPSQAELAALATGTFIVNEPAKVEEVLSNLLAGGSGQLLNKKENGSGSILIRDEFLTTEAERDALLGIRANEKS